MDIGELANLRFSTPGKRWRFRRDLVIYLAHRQGLSQRFLADVFDLPRSRIGEIIRKFPSSSNSWED